MKYAIPFFNTVGFYTDETEFEPFTKEMFVSFAGIVDRRLSSVKKLEEFHKFRSKHNVDFKFKKIKPKKVTIHFESPLSSNNLIAEFLSPTEIRVFESPYKVSLETNKDMDTFTLFNVELPILNITLSAHMSAKDYLEDLQFLCDDEDYQDVVEEEISSFVEESITFNPEYLV